MKQCIVLCLAVLMSSLSAFAATAFVGDLTDPQGRAVSKASISLLRRADSGRHEAKTDEQGHYSFEALESGEYRLTAEASGFPIITRNIAITGGVTQTENLQFSQLASQNQSVTVTADVSDIGLFAPDPAQRIMIRDETLDANPGRSGMPISIPGMPVESPAGG